MNRHIGRKVNHQTTTIMKGKFVVLLVVAFALLASCAKEDPVTTTGASKKAPAVRTNTTSTQP